MVDMLEADHTVLPTRKLERCSVRGEQSLLGPSRLQPCVFSALQPPPEGWLETREASGS